MDTSLTTGREAVEARLEEDLASRELGIRLDAVDEESVTVSFAADPWMLNGHGVLHGGMMFVLGDTAFAFLCEAEGTPSLSRQADITFIAPGSAQGRIHARATRKARYGRNSIVDVDLTDDAGSLLARMTVHGVLLPQPR